MQDGDVPVRAAYPDNERRMRTLEKMQSNLTVLDERTRGLSQALDDLRALRRPASPIRAAEAPRPVLTERQVRILRLIADGKDNTEIATELHYALGSIKLFVRGILKLLRSRTRAEAAARAVRLGLI